MLEVSRPTWRDYLDPLKIGMMAGAPSNHIPAVAVKELVDNALDESPSGGVEIEQIDGGVIVHDTGAGLSEEAALRIFSVSRDSRSSKALRMARRGMLGNGSRIIAAVAHLSGGSLTVESRCVGLRLGLDPATGQALVLDRFETDVTRGARMTLTIGEKLAWNGEAIRVYVHNAQLAEGVTFTGARACGSWFDLATMADLVRDAIGVTALEFARAFDLTPDAAAAIKARWRGKSSIDVYRDRDELAEFCHLVMDGCRPARPLKRIGRDMLAGRQYGFAESTFLHGLIQLPYAVEIWAEGTAVRDAETRGEINVAAIYLNRTPGLLTLDAHGSVSPYSRTLEIAVGNARVTIVDLLKKPCHFDLVVSIIAPTLPIISHGKAVDFQPFRVGIAEALRQALPKAYVKPLQTLDDRRRQEAAAKAEERADRAEERAAEEEERQRRRRERSRTLAEQAGALSAILTEERERTGAVIGDLDIMGPLRDPYRIGEREEAHALGRWVRAFIDSVRDGAEWTAVHIRKLHYLILIRAGHRKPDGAIYGEDAEDAQWLNEAIKAARWLGYLPFSWLRDQRNDPPTIAEKEPGAIAGPIEPTRVVHTPEIEVDLPEPEDVRLSATARFPRERNPYRLVVYAEKSHLADSLQPAADDYGADTYFPAGEISDSQLSQIAEDTIRDGRELALFTISDADPSGYQMPISIGHKLRALRDLYAAEGREFAFRVIPVAVTPEQARASGLPQSKLKDTDKRSARWRKAFAMEQLEADALAELQPRALDSMLREAMRPFRDPLLGQRQNAAEQAWIAEANATIDKELADDQVLAALRAIAADKRTAALEAIDQYEAAMSAIAEHLSEIEIEAAFPDFEVPEPVFEGEMPNPLVHSGMTLIDHAQTLKARKKYGASQ